MKMWRKLLWGLPVGVACAVACYVLDADNGKTAMVFTLIILSNGLGYIEGLREMRGQMDELLNPPKPIIRSAR